MAVEITTTYQGDLHCVAVHGPSGARIESDAPVDNEGKGGAFSPTDLVAASLGMCMLTIMGIVARRNNIELNGAVVHVTKEMAAKPVRRIARLTARVQIPNSDRLSAADRQRLEAAAAHCPVHQSLHPDIAIDVTFTYS